MIRLEVGKKYKVNNGSIRECVAIWSRPTKSGCQATLCSLDGYYAYNYTLNGICSCSELYNVIEEYKPKPRPFCVGDVTKTQNGLNARIACVDRKGEYPLVALVDDGDGYEIVLMCCSDGTYGVANDFSYGLIRTHGLVPLYEEEN